MAIAINGALGTITGLTAPVGFGGTTASNNITLTNASASDQYVTPSGYGYYATLPDATTLTKGANLYTIYNNSNFFYGIRNNDGTLLCFVPPYTSVPCSLADNTTAAGTWNFVNQQQLGTAAQATLTIASSSVPYVSATYGGLIKVVNLDSQYQVVTFCTDSNLYAVVYDQTNNSFGSVTLIRALATGSTASYYMPIKASATSVLIASCSGGTTGFQAVVLSISGTTITVNTAATATLASNITAFSDIQVVGSSYIVAYRRATNILGLRAMTISGTTVTISSETTVSGTSFSYENSAIFKTSSSAFMASSWGSTTAYVTPFTVSGTTLTAGTAGTATIVAGTNPFYYYLNSNNNLMFVQFSASNWVGYVASVSGTTATITSVNLVAKGTTASTFSSVGGALYTGNQILILFFQTTATAGAQYSIGFNVLTDSSGTAVAGTANVNQQTNAGGVAAYMCGFDSTSMYVNARSTTYSGTSDTYMTVGISGNDPSILFTSYFYPGSGINTSGSTAYLSRITNNAQRSASAESSMGNVARGEFMSVFPTSEATSTSANFGVVFGRTGYSVRPFSSLRLPAPTIESTATGYAGAPISNTYSNSTTLNQFGEYWSIAGVQTTQVASSASNKIVITRLVYA